jgi:hypothetical protein
LELNAAEFAPNFNGYSPKIQSNGRLKKSADRTVVRERFMWRDLSNTLRELWRASGEPCSAYRADLHYMRGPGPKWHAKYDGLLTQTSPPTAPDLPVETAQHHA